MTRILATYSIKGGVGKTTTAVNLAYLSARNGARSLVWDLDPQGAATYLFRIKPRVKGGGQALVRGRSMADRLVKGTDFDGLDLLPADLSYRHMDLHLDQTKRPTRRLVRVLAPLKKEYDCIILDCPPSLSLVSESVFEAAATVLVPMIPAPLPARTLDQLEDFLKSDGKKGDNKDAGRHPGHRTKRDPKVLAFFAMVDHRRRLHRQIVEDLVGSRSDVLSTEIPVSTIFEQMGVRREPVEVFAANSRAAEAYRALWQEVTNLI